MSAQASPKAGGSPKQPKTEHPPPEESIAADVKRERDQTGKPGVKDEPAVKTEAEEQAAAVGEKRKSGGKEPEKIIDEHVKKEEEEEEKHDPYYHEGYTDEEEEVEKDKASAAEKLKIEPKTDAEGKVTEEEKQRQEELERVARDLPDNTLEEGHIFFFYRPKVGARQTTNVDEVQRFQFILQPTVRKGSSPKDQMKCRLIVVGKKKLPNISKHERYYAFVAAVGDSVVDLTKGMGESGYTMKKGERSQGAAHLAGSGAYSLCMKAKARGSGGRRYSDVRLAYKLELPTEEEHGDCQQGLDIDREGYFVVSVKNPELKEESKAAGLPAAGPKPEYTDAQSEQMRGLRWAGPYEDVTVLDYKGTELLLIGGRNQLKTSLGPAADHLEALTEKDKAEAKKLSGGKDTKEALTEQLEQRVGGAPELSPTKDGCWK